MNYSNTGRLSPNQYKKNDKQPDHKGSITLERALVKQLLEESEDEVVIKIAGWNRSGQYGDFISLSYDSFKKQEEKPKAPPPAEEDIPF